jgi:hypothetical protein
LGGGYENTTSILQKRSSKSNLNPNEATSHVGSFYSGYTNSQTNSSHTEQGHGYGYRQNVSPSTYSLVNESNYKLNNLDSLDQMIEGGCSIPGLSDHYQNRKNSTAINSNPLLAYENPNTYNAVMPFAARGRQGSGKLSSREYASLLRAQIDEKNAIKHAEESRSSSSGSVHSFFL